MHAYVVAPTARSETDVRQKYAFSRAHLTLLLIFAAFFAAFFNFFCGLNRRKREKTLT